jgi:hypothetical protein
MIWPALAGIHKRRIGMQSHTPSISEEDVIPILQPPGCPEDYRIRDTVARTGIRHTVNISPSAPSPRRHRTLTDPSSSLPSHHQLHLLPVSVKQPDAAECILQTFWLGGNLSLVGKGKSNRRRIEVINRRRKHVDRLFLSPQIQAYSL